MKCSPPVTQMTGQEELSFTARTVVDNSLTYILELVSPEKLINDQKKVSASFPAKTPTDVAKIILSNNDFGLGIESRRIDFSNTQPVSNFIIPNWKPFKALNWLAKKSVSMTGGIDKKTGKFIWEIGPEIIAQQHDPHILSNGNVLIFGSQPFSSLVITRGFETINSYPSLLIVSIRIAI